MHIKNKILDFVKENQIIKKIDFIDIGAEKDIGKPFSYYVKSNLLKITGFEPNIKEYNLLTKNFSGRKYYNYALSNKKKISKFFLTKNNSASSLFEPNKKFNKYFISSNNKSRKIIANKLLKCIKLDSLENEIKDFDFIKIDTQGSELQILQGCRNILKKHSPIILLESWNFPIYKKTDLIEKILNFLRNLSYMPIEYENAASENFNNKYYNSKFDRPIKVGFEILFIPSLAILKKMNEDKILKMITILDLYGFKNLSLFLLDYNKNISKLHKNKIKNVVKKIIIIENILNYKIIKFVLFIMIRFKFIDPLNSRLHY